MQTIVLYLCYIVLILLFSTASNTSLIYCFAIWCLHTNKRRPCSSTLSGHPSSSNILFSKCASRHNGVHFFDISTAKSGPHLVFFVHFDFKMCFAPQACTFSTSQLPKVVRSWCVLYILTSKCASRHNGVQFFISHLARWLRTRRFSEPTFRPSGAPNHWKNTVFRDFTFSRICIFFLLTLSLL